MIIEVSDPQKIGTGTSAFISYGISYNNNSKIIRRRFQDFVNLHFLLTEQYPTSLCPPLPGKHVKMYFVGDRFSASFIQKRLMDLNCYLRKLARHPTLGDSPLFVDFLSLESWHMNAKSQVFDSLSDVLINAFAKVKSRNEKFISIEQQVSKFDQNLTLVEKPHSKLLKSLHDISSNYEELAQAVLSLAAMETQITEPLESFSNRLPNYASLVREHAVDHGYRFVGPLTEYTAYCQSAKNLLRLRDQKQIDHEELQTWLSNNSAARDRTMSTGRGLGIAGFIQDKINDFKGVDPESVRKSRLGQLDEKIGQLKEAVQNGHETEKLFSEQVEKEFELFSNYKQEDFSRYFSDYAASQIQFHKKVHLLTQSLEFWDSIYPTLEKISL